MTRVLAPLAGQVIPLSDVNDPVFAEKIVGSGLAVIPDTLTAHGHSDVVSPIAGTIIKALPHAFVVRSADGPAVLVHVGLDTVKADTSSFMVVEGDHSTVETAQPVVSWRPAHLVDGGFDLTTPVIVMDSSDAMIGSHAEYGTHVQAGDFLFEILPA